MSVYNFDSESSQTSANLNFSTKLHFLDGIPLAYAEKQKLKICLRSQATSQILIYTPDWRETARERCLSPKQYKIKLAVMSLPFPQLFYETVRK